MKARMIIFTILLSIMLCLAGCEAPEEQADNSEQAEAIQELSPEPTTTEVPATEAPAPEPVTTEIPAVEAPALDEPESQSASRSEQNKEIILEMVGKLNSGDVEGSLAYFTDDAISYLIGFPPTGLEIYRGKDALRRVWQDSANNHFEWEVEIQSATDDLVFVFAKTWHDFTRQLEVAPMQYFDIYELKDGKIITYNSTMTQTSLDKFKPAFAAAVPPEAAVAPSAEPGVSEMTVTFENGTCTTQYPLSLKAGEVKVTMDVKDQDDALYALWMANLEAGKDILDLMVATTGTPPSWATELLFTELGPGNSKTTTITVEQGPVYLVCFSQPPSIVIGNAGPIAVVP